MTLLPPNSTPLMRATEAAISRDLPVTLGSLWNPQTCPVAALPWLAWALHVTDSEGWANADTVQGQRDLLTRSFELHRQKGTVHSIKRALASIGFGDQSRLIEGGMPRTYDGTHFADGSLTYSSASWAEYAIEADLGENSGLSASVVDRIRATCTEYAPVSRHLGNVTFTAHVSDSAPPAEQIDIELQLDGLSDITPWRRRYDGSLQYDQGIPLTYGGHLSANGTYLYAGGYAANDSHWRAGEEETVLDFSAQLSQEDYVRRFAIYDGSSQADGLIDYGASAPCAEDAVMQITAVRRLGYNSKYRYDGSITANSGIPFLMEAA